jgi:hypothetical protein
MTEDQYKIVGQINVALEKLGAPVELLCLVGSFGQSQEDSDVLEMLEQYNECGTYMQDTIAVNDMNAKDFIHNEPAVKH